MSKALMASFKTRSNGPSYLCYLESLGSCSIHCSLDYKYNDKKGRKRKVSEIEIECWGFSLVVAVPGEPKEERKEENDGRVFLLLFLLLPLLLLLFLLRFSDRGTLVKLDFSIAAL